MSGEVLQLSAVGREWDVHYMIFQWNWQAMRGMDPNAEIAVRMGALRPVIATITEAYPRAYILTNDETFISNKPHRHMEDIGGNLEPQILRDYDHRVVPFEFCWGRLELGHNRWSYLLDLDELPLDRFGRDLLGMTINPVCYNFIFARSTVSLDQLVDAMSIPKDAAANDARLWQNQVLGLAGFLAFPEEESTLVLKSKDSPTIETLRQTSTRLGRSKRRSAGNRQGSRQST